MPARSARPRCGHRLRTLHRALGRLALGCLTFLLLAAPPARAHQSSLVYSDISVRGREVRYTFQIASTDLYEAIGLDMDRPATREEVEHARARLGRYLVERVHVTEGGEDCPGTPGALGLLDKTVGFFAVVEVTYQCPRLVREAAVRYDLFFDLDPRHQGLAHISLGGDKEREAVLRADARDLALRPALGLLDHVRDYLHLGVEHIFTGYDHLSFLFGLLVLAAAGGLVRGTRQVLVVVSAFTVAHSLTLIASALGWLSLDPRLVEPAIALSIVYVGIENLRAPQTRHRWLLTFGFGLIHGFGFASVLREIGLPERGLLLSLVSFNLGVELGQLAVVAVLLPLLALLAARARPGPLALALLLAALGGFTLLGAFGVARPPLALVCFGLAPLMTLGARRWGYERVVRQGGSLLLAALASFWFLERVTGQSWLGGYLG